MNAGPQLERPSIWRPDGRSVALVIALLMTYFVSLRIDDLSGTLRILFGSETTRSFAPPAVLQRLEVAGLVAGGFQLVAALAAAWQAVTPRAWSRWLLITGLAGAALTNVAAMSIGALSVPSHPVSAYLVAVLLHVGLAAALVFATTAQAPPQPGGDAPLTTDWRLTHAP